MQTFSQMLSEYDYDLMRIDEIKFSETKKKHTQVMFPG